jgi:murein DD-endopeptidase MepM/ murein hydrolase activator NlpD
MEADRITYAASNFASAALAGRGGASAAPAQARAPEPMTSPANIRAAIDPVVDAMPARDAAPPKVAEQSNTPPSVEIDLSETTRVLCGTDAPPADDPDRALERAIAAAPAARESGPGAGAVIVAAAAAAWRRVTIFAAAPANALSVAGLATAIAATTWYFAALHVPPATAAAPAARPPAASVALPARPPAPPPARVPARETAKPAETRAPAAEPAGPPAASADGAALLARLHFAAQTPFHTLGVRAEKGDTLASVLFRAGVSRAEAQAALVALAPVYDARRLRPEQIVYVLFGVHDGMHGRFLGLRLDSSYDRTVSVRRQASGHFAGSELRKRLTAELMRGNGVIESSPFDAAIRAGVRAEVAIPLFQLFAFDVDFQRDIRRGDAFEVLHEIHRDPKGEIAHRGAIVYAGLAVQGVRLQLYLYTPEEGETDYFNEAGESSRKALMRTPIEGARLSSGFGLRRHPILGFSKQHNGVDFAAPIGTPIFAAGAGTIEKLGWHGGYGNYILIRHNKEFATAYAHMSGYAAGLAPGRRVRQGDVIGYVGSTGLSTGPHLHYEVHQNEKPIDPAQLKLPAGQKLKGRDLVRFLAIKRQLDERFKELGANGVSGAGLIAARPQPAERDPAADCVNGLRLDPTDRRPCN